MGTGFNFQRRIIGGAGGNNISQERRQGHFAGTAPVLQRAVVVDVIFDPASLTDAQLEAMEDSVGNPEVVGFMPQNSIIASVVTNGQNLGDSTSYIFFPLFSSHVQLPIKPGEQVHVIYEDYSGQGGNSLGYWVSRVVSPRTVEDLNYTHYDRIYDPFSNLRNLSTSQRGSIPREAPTFPNGAGTPESRTLRLDDNNPSANPFNTIINQSVASFITTFEPVPRVKKRPADLAFYGSNNTAIILGQDRTGPALRVTGSSGIDIVDKSGTIDIVAGLGGQRSRSVDNPTSDPSETNNNPTGARAVLNSRNKKETDKQPYRNQRQDNPKEGDPDFKRDLSRVYVSMKTKGDRNFGVKLQDIYPSNGGPGSTKFFRTIDDLPDTNQEGQPFVVLKSQHLRMIAQGQDSTVPLDQASSGDIRFIKTGTVANKDLSMLIFDKEGNIVGLGKNIQLQTHQDGNIFIACKDGSTGNSDPAILYSRFEELSNDVLGKINSLADQITTLSNDLGNILNAPASAAPFSPIPSLVAMRAYLATVPGRIATFKAGVEQVKNTKIKPCRSSRIYLSKDSKGNT